MRHSSYEWRAHTARGDIPYIHSVTDPMSMFILKSLSISFLVALAETVNGIVRIRFLNHRLGGQRASRLSLLTGCLLIAIISWLSVPWLGVSSPGTALLTGFIWLTVLLCYDIFIGRFVFKVSWKRVRADFDPRRGNYLAIGMAFLFVAPTIVWLIRG